MNSLNIGIDKDSLLEKFLVIPSEFKKEQEKSYLWVYKIINYKNSKVYIGKTNNLHQRALNYINDFLKGYSDRKILKAMQDIGIQNFIMTPIEYALNDKSLEIKEKYYIDLYDSIDNGYNSTIQSGKVYNHQKRNGAPQTLYAKIIKSKVMISVNPEQKCIVISIGGKLFGDFINRHKDEVKSAAKRETKLEGFFIYYLNDTDFNSQINSANLKIAKNINYKDYKLQYYDFIKYSNMIKKFLQTKEIPNGFNVKFIVQDNSEIGYEFRSIDEFFTLYENYSKRII